MRILTSFLKYCREENDINKELFSQVRNDFTVNLPKRFDLKFDKFIAETLNNYYEEQIRKAYMFGKDQEDWIFSFHSHKVLGYLLSKYTNNEIFERRSHCARFLTCYDFF